MMSSLPHVDFRPSTCRINDEHQAACFSTIGSLLPHIGITKRSLKKLEAIRHQRDQNKPELASNARSFVLCGSTSPSATQPSSPYQTKRPLLPGSHGARLGRLPDSHDRLTPIGVATLGLKQKSRIVRFDSAGQMLDFFRLPRSNSWVSTPG